MPRRDGMGRYSRVGSDMIHELRELMDDAPDDKTRQEFQRFILNQRIPLRLLKSERNAFFLFSFFSNIFCKPLDFQQIM